MCDGQAVWIVLLRLMAVAVAEDKHIEVAAVDVAKATIAYRFAVGQVAVRGLVTRLHQPIDHRLAFGFQVGDSGRDIHFSHQRFLDEIQLSS